ncbi:hypothetical protein [Oricola cellulosilytica]|uniref:Uncharacterized protein n=1 Tax=Oricola cellulosilytica TaxID=1429082 RepID=A0A4R0PG82_9HYPH|nr:hypothetical protein [Oricola cellulosilytica]TCD15933.1 hypothetical protein E0D97_00380 [Oricola cellulosilytica]
MAIIALSSLRRWIGAAARHLKRTTAILLVMIVAGAAISFWARSRIDALLSIDDGAVLAFSVSDIEGDCGTPSVYVVPESEGSASRYRLLVDFLGGPNRFPMLGGGDTVPVLALPASRAPGVGLGRGIPETCEHVAMTITGDFSSYRFEDDFPGVGKIPARSAPHMALEAGDGGKLNFAYRKPDAPSEAAALAAVTLSGVEDRWQQGSRRVALINEGARDINVFVHEEPGFQFVNEQNALVRPVGVRRAFVDAHLGPRGGSADDSVVVYWRKPTSEIELQHALVGISTIFGIGVSLLVEGMIVLVISIASAGGAGSRRSAATRQNQNETTGESQETS